MKSLSIFIFMFNEVVVNFDLSLLDGLLTFAGLMVFPFPLNQGIKSLFFFCSDSLCGSVEVRGQHDLLGTTLPLGFNAHWFISLPFGRTEVGVVSFFPCDQEVCAISLQLKQVFG